MPERAVKSVAGLFFLALLFFRLPVPPSVVLLAELALIMVLMTGFKLDDSQELDERLLGERIPAREMEEQARPRALIVGADRVGQALARNLELRGQYEVVGFADDGPDAAYDGPWPVLGDKFSIPALVAEYGVDEVFVASRPAWQQHMLEQLVLSESRVTVKVVPSAYEAMLQTDRLESASDMAIMRLSADSRRAWDGPKRLLDIFAATILLVLASPVLLIAALLIKIASPGTVFYAQRRVGRHGIPFTVYKLRTMIQNAERLSGPRLSDGDLDPRVTPIGRWLRSHRIDELPQLWNVLRGDMSMIGPRPERAVFVEQFEQTLPLYALRHRIRPGITGLAQVHGHYRSEARDKLRFDLIYVARRSFMMDLRVALQTILVVISSEGS